MNSNDWEAVLSSEIFRTYVNNELTKEAANEVNKKNEEAETIEQFELFQKKVNASQKLKGVFKKLQHAFLTDPEYTAKVDPKFVEGVLLLDIEE